MAVTNGDGHGPVAAGTKPLAQVQREVMTFLTQEAGFAQVCTIGREGFPVARTMGAPVNADWSVDLVQRAGHQRLGQLRRNPRLVVIWLGSPAPGSANDHPHVYDFGLAIPRAVFLRGVAEFMGTEWTIERFQRLTATHRARGQVKAPERTVADIRAQLVGIRVRPIRVRAEGFGTEAQTYTWTVAETT